MALDKILNKRLTFSDEEAHCPSSENVFNSIYSSRSTFKNYYIHIIII